jgi:hypothetical protein
MSKLQRLGAICFLSILIAPTFSDEYSAQAGRLVAGNVASPYCDCGLQAPPVCYDETTWQVCSTEPGGGDRRTPTTPEKDADKTIPISMVVLTFLLLIKRLF